MAAPRGTRLATRCVALARTGGRSTAAAVCRAPGAGRAIEALEATGVLVETTGKKRDRVYAYQAYLDRLRGDGARRGGGREDRESLAQIAPRLPAISSTSPMRNTNGPA